MLSKTKVAKELRKWLLDLASQLEHIAELMDRIHGRREAGTKQAEYKDAATIINEVEKQCGFAGKIKNPTAHKTAQNETRKVRNSKKRNSNTAPPFEIGNSAAVRHSGYSKYLPDSEV
ncbi:hypothetical protein [Xenorhabdus eapokensis]|uniref:Uncharacterized protein n=1 Tax=Xenorhabdus eapokensis TaxID=1873482 RepID=A0A1Q5THJ3_9GAMM|nr:hypothetical protein [Xenorhabdus eapokensis]OKO99693.1 hypothetical protein Xedl_03575 [Xenorhabdus eapokensis]